MIEDNKLIKYNCYSLDDNIPYISWTFEYDANMSIYREFPFNNGPKELFCDKNGRTDKVIKEGKQLT